MSIQYDLERFRKAQDRDYAQALSEIKAGKKRSHWIWYIFPQLKGLGFSPTSERYGLDGLGEAKAYLEDPVLRERLLEISSALLQLQSSNALDVMGYPDNLKLLSCMTIFSAAEPENEVFKSVLDKFFAGRKDERTLELIGE